MKTILHKAYVNYEKEEKWLNEMAAKGLALTDYSWCRYVFADGQPGEYVYRIELLAHTPSHPESRKYIRFMEESGVEHIASYMRWVYFRKKASGGAFELYSDADSKIKHYKRIAVLWLCLACCNLLAGISNVYIAVGLFLKFKSFNFNFIGGGICIVIGIMLIALCIAFGKKIGRLKKEKLVLE